MKTITKFAYVAAAAMFMSFSAKAQNDNSLEGRATSEVAPCLAKVRAQGFTFFTGEETNGSCFNGGFIRTVTFYRTNNCQDTPTRPCPDPLVIL